MKKTTNVTLGGYPFILEEDAYQVLKQYLDAVAAHFARYPDAKEIVADMESRIAERFAENLRGPTAERVVAVRDVEELIAAMGTVRDLADEDGARSAGTEESKGRAERRLMRDVEGQMIGGVAGGIAAYFGIDPVIMRVFFVVGTIFGGWGLGAYIILWLVMPPARTEMERMQMRGEPLTIEAIERFVRERVEANKEPRGKIRSAIAAGAETAGPFARQVGTIGAKIIGVVLVIAGAAGIMATVFGLAVLIANIDPLSNGLSAIAPRAALIAFIVALYYAVFAPFALLATAGGMLARLRFDFNRAVAVGLALLWVATLATMAAIGTRYAPRIIEAIENDPAYATTATTFEAKDVRELDLSGDYSVAIVPGKSFSVKAEGPKMATESLVVATEGKTLKVSQAKKGAPCLVCHLRVRLPLVLTITMPEIDRLSLGGSVRAEGDIGTAEDVTISLKEGAELRVTGKTERLVVETRDVAALRGFGLTAETAVLRTFHGSRADVRAERSLNVIAEDSSEVRYVGDPALLGVGAVSPQASVERVDQTPEEGVE